MAYNKLRIHNNSVPIYRIYVYIYMYPNTQWSRRVYNVVRRSLLCVYTPDFYISGKCGKAMRGVVQRFLMIHRILCPFALYTHLCVVCHRQRAFPSLDICIVVYCVLMMMLLLQRDF